MSSLSLMVLIFSSLIYLTHSLSSPLTAHTVLTNYGFPVGLLPNADHTYTLNSTSGEFSVQFSGGDCQMTLPPDNYVAVYSRVVRGRIVDKGIKDLKGIRVWAYFKWWSLTGIRVSEGKDLVFEVGVVTAKYPVVKFGEILECERKKRSSS